MFNIGATKHRADDRLKNAWSTTEMTGQTEPLAGDRLKRDGNP
jgi:hypothetical protein